MAGAVEVPTKSGNPYHDPDTGQFTTSPDATTQAARDAAGTGYPMDDPEYVYQLAEDFNEEIYERAQAEDGDDRPLVEYGWFIGPDGKVGARFKGDKNGIEMERDEVVPFIENGSWFFHNHPERWIEDGDGVGKWAYGGCPSLNDYYTSLRAGTKGFIATTTRGYYKVVFDDGLLRAPEAFRVIVMGDALENRFRDGWEIARQEAEYLIQNGGHPALAFYNHSSELWKYMSSSDDLNQVINFEFVPWRNK